MRCMYYCIIIIVVGDMDTAVIFNRIKDMEDVSKIYRAGRDAVIDRALDKVEEFPKKTTAERNAMIRIPNKSYDINHLMILAHDRKSIEFKFATPPRSIDEATWYKRRVVGLTSSIKENQEENIADVAMNVTRFTNFDSFLSQFLTMETENIDAIATAYIKMMEEEVNNPLIK